ncbi:aquaporin [Mycoplasmopsis cynos]|uniref:aquaporin n=1 Tax=Mycoplasmopsis cynos TaxID=171284 RepID=UPI0024C5809C|nr:aquaporin [Mycoplasmopsis cynos]WAM06522.1 aquaporin [Mycoplasmopsis cynos]
MVHTAGYAFSNKEGGTIFNFSYELVGTLVLVGVILAVSKTNFQNITGIIVTMIVMSIGLSIGASTGYAINPARDLYS